MHMIKDKDEHVPILVAHIINRSVIKLSVVLSQLVKHRIKVQHSGILLIVYALEWVRALPLNWEVVINLLQVLDLDGDDLQAVLDRSFLLIVIRKSPKEVLELTLGNRAIHLVV